MLADSGAVERASNAFAAFGANLEQPAAHRARMWQTQIRPVLPHHPCDAVETGEHAIRSRFDELCNLGVVIAELPRGHYSIRVMTIQLALRLIDTIFAPVPVSRRCKVSRAVRVCGK